ncbi:MAG: succinate dehydrogenase assembly factor 2 [Lysobacteraceae bacterium]
MSGKSTDELGRLRWRSRRGMKELDGLLQRYLDNHWRTASSEERAAYERLLACEDTALWRWFLGHETPQEPELVAIVGRIADSR